MQDFFHADTTKYKRFARRFSIALGIFLSLPVVLCFLSLMLGFRQLSEPGFVTVRLAVAAGCAALWLLLSFAVYIAAELKIRRNSRYTYLEIQPCAAVFSRYGGSWRVLGDTTLSRTLYVIPFDGTEIKYDKGAITFSGRIRRYDGDSERLGYHVKHGVMKFDNWWLEENGYTELKSFSLPPLFSKPGFIFRCCKLAQNRCLRMRARKDAEKTAQARKNRPLPPLVRRSLPASRRKRVYTEIPTFNRNW